jgi:predicted DsbA family dithiol-disulfide isomerase
MRTGGAARPLRIDVFADIACPWCYIGEARLERALAARPAVDVEWRWRPFQLQPGLPAGGVPWAEFAEQKFGGLAHAERMFAHVTAVGAADGLDFRFERMASAPNTGDAHRLVLFAGRAGLQRGAAAALFRAYFSEGRDLNDPAALAEVGAAAGLDADALREHLRGGADVDAVLRSQEEARRLGVTGVPFYVFDGRFAVSGAQPEDAFVQAIDSATALAPPPPR